MPTPCRAAFAACLASWRFSDEKISGGASGASPVHHEYAVNFFRFFSEADEFDETGNSLFEQCARFLRIDSCNVAQF
jgi:hypothetical protein